jgi:RNA polymerase sigma-70 factor (ECF subfamily)
MDGDRATRMDGARERALVDRARTDAAAFAELYDFYLPRIHGFVLRRVRERPVAEDVTATTFQRALEALRGGRFRNEAFGGWLYRVAANAVVDHVRAAGRVSPEADVADVLGTDGAADAFAAALDRDELRRAMAALPDGHRAVLTLRFFDDLDAAEASTILGCSRAAFAVRLHRALAALRGAMLTDLPAEATDAA